MSRRFPHVLQVLLLASLAVRLAVGAPCCWEPASPDAEISSSGHHAMAAMEQPDAGHHGGDDGDNRAGPCCSACGPALADGAAPVIAAAAPPGTPALFALEELPRRDLLRLYEATGPPLLT